MSTFLRETKSNGCEYFEGISLSTQDFYSSLEKVLESRNDFDVVFSRVNLSESGLFSPNREYLRITRRGLSVDICAAPFSKGFFISSWMGEKGSFIIDLLSEIPILGPFIARTKIRNKTYFQADTEAMFKMFVQQAIQDVVHEIKATKGERINLHPEVQPK